MCKLLVGYGLGPMLLAVALHGMLRDGVTACMPVLITENYPAFSSAKSVLTAAILPLFAIASLQAAGAAAKKIGNEIRSAGLFYGAGALAALGLALCLNLSRAGAHWLPAGVALMALLTGCMHGVNLTAVCQLPARFGRFGATGAAAGVINAFVYAGSALSMLGTALLAERFGWQATAWVWLAAAAAGTGIFAMGTKRAREVLY
jgi:OPA family glycerol-3-phosphate transporter-like MFS transporter